MTDKWNDEGKLLSTHCYMCEPDIEKRFEQDAEPLRKVLMTFVTNVIQDPTQAYKLECGHTII
jgi:hypothetical protein